MQQNTPKTISLKLFLCHPVIVSHVVPSSSSFFHGFISIRRAEGREASLHTTTQKKLDHLSSPSSPPYPFLAPNRLFFSRVKWGNRACVLWGVMYWTDPATAQQSLVDHLTHVAITMCVCVCRKMIAGNAIRISHIRRKRKHFFIPCSRVILQEVKSCFLQWILFSKVPRKQ